MIARTWRGSTRAEDAESYLAYLHRTGLAAYQATPGNRGAIVFRRVAEGRAEFFLDDDRYLVGRDLHVDHFDVVYAAGELAALGAA
jgi:hypothetical protein